MVHGEIPRDVVVAGNPARVICTLEEHLQKRRKRTVAEAVQVAKSYKENYGKMPFKNDMIHFKELFGGNAVPEKKWSNFDDFLKEIEN